MDHSIELLGRKFPPEALAAPRYNFSDSHMIHLAIRACRMRVILSWFASGLQGIADFWTLEHLLAEMWQVM